MLAELVSVQFDQFTALADAWIGAGASAFGIWRHGRPIAGWADVRQLHQPSLVASIRIGDQVVGDLRVAGISGPQVKARLMVDAGLVASMVRQEQDLQQMTAELVDRQDQLLALFELTRSLRRHLTIEETLRCLVDEAVRLVGSAGGFAVFVSDSTAPTLVRGPSLPLDEQAIWDWYWQTQIDDQDLLVLDYQLGDKLPPGVGNLLLVRVRLRGSLTALLGLVNKPGNGLSSADVKLAGAIAEQASAQLQNVLLYQETIEQARLQTEMELARRVQLSLLPQKIPSVAGLDVYAYTRPALHVGGDFYDVIDRPERPWTFSVGDVAGKGFSAALLMAMTRLSLNSKASFMPEPTPEGVIRQSNEDLNDDFAQVGLFATVFVGQYRPETRLLQYANAGHSPVIYRPAGGRSTLLRADSTAIGILAAHRARNHTIRLGPGDLLLVATDGLCDVSGPDETLFGHSRLLELVEQLAELPARAIADGLFAVLDRFAAGTLQGDDQTLMVLKGVAT